MTSLSRSLKDQRSYLTKLFKGNFIFWLCVGILFLCDPALAFQTNSQEKQEKKEKVNSIKHSIKQSPRK